MKKEITRFWSAVFVILAILVVIDVSIGVIMDRVMFKLPDYSSGGQLVKDNFRLHRLHTDIVIIGSSRGSHHYVTSQLRDSIHAYMGKHYTIYNAAIDGKFANSNSCAAECIIARYHPKLVIYDIPERQLRRSSVDDVKISSPYYWTDSIVHRYLDNISLRESVLMKSSCYRYNRRIFRIISNLIIGNQINDGYEPLYGTSIDTTIITRSTKQKSIEKLNLYSVNNFTNVLRKYQELGVPLVIACSPQFRPSVNNQELEKICSTYQTPFIDMYDLTTFNDHPELFKDEGHLNDDGAHVYTAMFFEELKPYLTLMK